MGKRLTVKQEKFCVNYFKLGNATEAALVAGYSPHTAQVMASQNLTKPMVQARLKALQQKTEDESVATVLERKQILTEIIRTPITAFIELGADGSWVNIGAETPHSIVIQEIHSRTEYDKNGSKPTVYTSVKLASRLDAVKELNKMDGVYSDGATVTVDNRQQSITYQIINPSTKELIERLKNGEREPKADGDISQEPGSLPGGQTDNQQ